LYAMIVFNLDYSNNSSNNSNSDRFNCWYPI